MSLVNKLKDFKEQVISECDEYIKTSNMSADELASRYGYEKILNRFRRKYLLACGEAYDEEFCKITIRYEIIKNNPNEITILEMGFGEKEYYNLNIVKKILEKDGYRLEDVEVNEKEHALIGYKTNVNYIKKEEETVEETEEETVSDRIKEQIKGLYENKEEYIEQAINLAKETKVKAGNVTKKTLRNLADWADKNL